MGEITPESSRTACFLFLFFKNLNIVITLAVKLPTTPSLPTITASRFIPFGKGLEFGVATAIVVD
jgi:hypothetical protein